MAEARIRRGGTARLSTARGKVRAKAGSGRGRQLKRQSSFDRLLELLPISEDTLQKLATWAIFAIFGGIGTVAAIALAGAAPHRVESHAGTAHPAAAKRQNAQTGIAVQCQAEAAGAVDQVGTNRAPGVPAIGGKLPGSHL